MHANSFTSWGAHCGNSHNAAEAVASSIVAGRPQVAFEALLGTEEEQNRMGIEDVDRGASRAGVCRRVPDTRGK